MQKVRINGTLASCMLVLLCVAAVSGQRKLNFRIVEIGAGPAMVSLQDNDPRVLRYPKASIAASAGLVYSLKRRLFFTTHAMYELKGGKATQTFADAESAPVSLNTSSSYITFAPGIRHYLGNSSVFLEGGPFISFLLSSNTKSRVGNGGEANIGNPFTAVDAGVGVSLGLTPWRRELKGFNVRFVNNFGLADIDHHTGTKETTYSMALILGMRVRMN